MRHLILLSAFGLLACDSPGDGGVAPAIDYARCEQAWQIVCETGTQPECGDLLRWQEWDPVTGDVTTTIPRTAEACMALMSRSGRGIKEIQASIGCRYAQPDIDYRECIAIAQEMTPERCLVGDGMPWLGRFIGNCSDMIELTPIEVTDP